MLATSNDDVQDQERKKVLGQAVRLYELGLEVQRLHIKDISGTFRLSSWSQLSRIFEALGQFETAHLYSCKVRSWMGDDC